MPNGGKTPFDMKQSEKKQWLATYAVEPST